MRIFSIGHSNHRLDDLMGLLSRHGVTAIADVRSNPHSDYVPQYNIETLPFALKQRGMPHVFLGKELGGWPEDPSLYTNDLPDYQKMEASEIFNSGVDRLFNGMSKFNLAMMCSEGDPLQCHRCFLLGRHLAFNDVEVLHIERSGTLLSQTKIDEIVVDLCRKKATRGNAAKLEKEMPINFDSPDLVSMAYDRQARLNLMKSSKKHLRPKYLGENNQSGPDTQSKSIDDADFAEPYFANGTETPENNPDLDTIAPNYWS